MVDCFGTFGIIVLHDSRWSKTQLDSFVVISIIIVSDDREENEMRNYGNHTELNVSYSLVSEIDVLITIFSKKDAMFFPYFLASMILDNNL